MLLIEVAHPSGTLDEQDRDQMCGSILDLFIDSQGHAEELHHRVRESTHIGFRELYGWRTGHGVPPQDAAPPMIITVTTPDAWREAAGTFIGLLRTAVRRLDDARGWKRARGSLWVRVDGVPDGSIGLDGRPATADDVLNYLTADFQAAKANGTAAPAPAGKLTDPICGMTVSDGKGTVTLEENGVRVGFCAKACRDAYLRTRG